MTLFYRLATTILLYILIIAGPVLYTRAYMATGGEVCVTNVNVEYLAKILVVLSVVVLVFAI